MDDVINVLRTYFSYDLNAQEASPRLLVAKESGVFLVRLELEYLKQTEPGFHFTVYHAGSGAILDQMSGKTAVIVNDSDRAGSNDTAKNRAALRPFKATFSEASKLTITSIHELVKMK